MDPNRWRRIEEVYQAALARPLQDRQAFLTETCGPDHELRREVEELLAQSGTGFFGTPPLAAIGEVTSSVMTGRRIGVYEVREGIGRGGMGEVYRARDTKLGRDVAIKILPRVFTSDPDRLARFEREARVLASLNHSNIATVHGVEERDGLQALVMELVEGETLAERIRAKPSGLPVSEALSIARQIADALDAAHEKGIVHRDLKPANIKIRPDGTVKVLDFGLARVVDAGSGHATDSQSPTATVDRTSEGLVMGTAAYMSPEQARGQAVDKRADIWAFGCVLYEMLTGRAVFARGTLTDTLAAVVNSEPDWDRVPPGVPPQVQHLLRRCLTKDPRQRLRDIGDAAAELSASRGATASTPTVVRTRSLAKVLPWAFATLAVAGLVFVVMRQGPTGNGSIAQTMERLTADSGLTEMPAVSRDGRLLAYTSDRAAGNLDVWVQQIGGGAPVRLTDDPADDVWPDFSPDGSQIVFRSERGGGGIYVVPAFGGAARLIVAEGRRPKFSPDGSRIAYWAGQWRGLPSVLTSGIFVAPLSGGQPMRLAPDFIMARDPVWAPDGKSLLFLGLRDRASPVESVLDWWSAPIAGGMPIKTGLYEGSTPTALDARQPSPSAWTAGGALFSIDGEIWRAVLSADRGLLQRVPERIAISAAQSTDPIPMGDGSVVFGARMTRRVIARVSLVNQSDPPVTLYTDERSAAQRATPTEDGEIVVYEQWSANQREIWLRNVRTETQQMIIRIDDGRQTNAILSPDGKRIVYTIGSDNPGSNGYVVEVAGGVPRQVCHECVVHGFLPDNRSAIGTIEDNKALGVIDLATGKIQEIVRVAMGLIDRPHVSPDGRWLAFRYTRNAVSKTYVGPMRPAEPPPSSVWQEIDEPTATGRPTGWSLDSRVLYLLLDTDGFRCVWAQRIDPASGRATGPLTAARHFHGADSAGLGGPSTSYGNPFTKQGFVYETEAASGNIWKLTAPAR